MSFTQPIFLFYFLPVVLFIYWLLPQKTKLFFLVLSSCLFYYWGTFVFTWILLSTIILNYFFGIIIGKTNQIFFKKTFLAIGIICNLSLLFYYKYADFFSSNLSIILNQSSQYAPIVIPLAISFFTFHAISYLFDIYHGKSPAEKNLLKLLGYFLFFPHLIAGPILRYHQIEDSLSKPSTSLENISTGLYRFTIGLSKKILIADTLAPYVNEIFAISPQHLSTSEAWVGIIGFSLQIYFDFSGYSDMAIGLAKMFGFQFPENFNLPYMATSITNFWQRWHITLSQWFRDYLYIPLGGNRLGLTKTYLNLLIVFLLCGLWHGANWTFVIWGLFHGLILVLERFISDLKSFTFPSPIKWIYSFLLVSIGWVFFRSPDLTYATSYLEKMFLLVPSNQTIYYPLRYFLTNEVLIALIFGVIFSTSIPQFLKQIFQIKNTPIILKVSVYLLLLISSIIVLSSETYSSFIYFRF